MRTALIAALFQYASSQWLPRPDALILNTNFDNSISAIKDYGVRFDYQGRTLGTGTGVNGDSVLSMCDLNKNGMIDGSEVFGSLTVSPITMQPLKANNGFEALYGIAEAFDKKSTSKIIEKIRDATGNEEIWVNMTPLLIELRKIGCTLQAISGEQVRLVTQIPIRSIRVKPIAQGSEPTDPSKILFGERSVFIDGRRQNFTIQDVTFPQPSAAIPPAAVPAPEPAQ